MRFEKISYEQWEKDFLKLFPYCSLEYIKNAYNNIQLPQSSTESSAGHDFFVPFEIDLIPENDMITIPTGIRWITQSEEDKHTVLIICPRSGLGTKYGMRLSNTIGIIDADYCNANNEGHVMAAVEIKKNHKLAAGDKFMQGIIVPFIHCGENNINKRTGGFGSTGE